jgi:predicted Zn-ribbon and HTH transcriptional regulator
VVQHAAGCATVEQAVAAERGRGMVAEVFREHGRDYLKRHDIALAHISVIRDILRCRTAELGGNRRTCPHCGYTEIHYCSCGNRHCPTCQWSERAKWILKRVEQVLPVGHFFVTFTLPGELRGVALQNPVEIYNLMFRSVSRTLKKLARDHLGARLGILAVLHTWTRELNYHPHVHCVVTAGGLAEGELGELAWRPTRPNFLFPFAEMKALYRKQMLQGLYRLYERGKLQFLGEQEELGQPWAFGRLVAKLWKQRWVVDVQSPRGQPEHAVKYLANYTHRVAISDHRMVSVADGRVCFKTRDDKTLTLDAEEFIRRFLLHVLPPGFHKTRPYGLYSRSSRTDLETARQLIAPQEREARTTSGKGRPSLSEAESWEDVVEILTGVDPRLCPRCGREGMVMTSLAAPAPQFGAVWENTT